MQNLVSIMTKQQIQKEWEWLRRELVGSRLRIRSPYPPDMVLTRELLLFVRFVLWKFEIGEHRSFYESLYRRIVSFCRLQKHNINGHIVWKK